MPSDLTAAREALAAAHKMVADLCKRQGEPGWRRWEMSIPARPDHDPDLVIGAALDAGDALLAEVDRLTACVADAVAERDHAVLCYNIAVRPDLAGPAMLDEDLPDEPTEAMRVRSLHLRTAFWTLGVLAQAHPDAVNHLAFVLTMPDPPDDAPPAMKGLAGWRLEVAAIKPGAKGPSQMRAEAVEERDEALAEVARLRAEKAPPEPPATTTHSAENQGWTWSNVPVLAPDATAEDAAAGEQDPEALRAAIRALTQEVKHLRAELVRVQGEVLDVD